MIIILYFGIIFGEVVTKKIDSHKKKYYQSHQLYYQINKGSYYKIPFLLESESAIY